MRNMVFASLPSFKISSCTTESEGMPLNVFIADDHTLVRSGIRALIEAAPELNVVGEASNGREAVERIQALQPELVLMDVAMEELNGIDAAQEGACDAAADTRIIMLSMHEDRQYVFESLKGGRDGIRAEVGGVSGSDLCHRDGDG